MLSTKRLPLFSLMFHGVLAIVLLAYTCNQVQAATLDLYGCSGRNFQGECQSFSCGYQDCCRLPEFFQTRLVSVRATGAYNVRLFTDAGCAYHCNDNDNGARFVDHEGWTNIGAAAYACVDGPY
ncbi:hypothetical protein K457DRAFT_141542 [Linnemannia elongata AG-77]|uniref:Uncharacterized protein n=1 Tax=Linnemannia elongata AG-77 TaxID=1314771 RepID=A0A197JKK6_9FUNG|nr:hypothetical protein K457DRAFT_141542 [Linnemannia elongata AG-77]